MRSVSDFWLDLGFRANPYAVRALTPTADGRRLLVGRDDELAGLTRRVRNSDLHPVLEGQNGVGKTSLVAVAAYVMSQDYKEGRSQQLFLPLGEPLQMKDNGSELTRDVYFAIAQAFIAHHDDLRAAGRTVPKVDDLETWLNAPTYRSSKGGGVSTPLGGGNAAMGTGLNTGSAFTDSGFQTMLRRALQDAFPENTGGFVGTLDNLELLDTSSSARRVLEEIRDPVLQLPGLRWVLCGARGIARSLANTPRLNGVLADPVDLFPVERRYIESLIDARVQVFSVDEGGRANTPVNADGFGYIYDVSNENLRDTFGYAQDFALDHDPAFFLDSLPAEIEDSLMTWVDRLAEKSARDVRLQARMWRLLEDLATAGGTAAPGDHETYGFNDRTHMRKNVVELERFDLAISSRDEIDGRRRSISLTSKGWLVHFAKKRDLLGQSALDLSMTNESLADD